MVQRSLQLRRLKLSHLRKEFDLLLVRGFLNPSTTHNSLWIDINTNTQTHMPYQQRLKRGKYCTVCVHLVCYLRLTQMCNELLSNLHPLQQLLEEAVSEPFLDGRDLLLHVFQAPAQNVYSQMR